jgi:hypothetical protein
MSAREIGRELTAARLRKLDAINDAIHVAWKTAYYTVRARSKKGLPKLQGEFLKDSLDGKPPRARQTKEQTATMIRMLAAQYGGTIRRIEGGIGG